MALFRWGKSRQSEKGRGALSLVQARLERGEVLLGDLHELKSSLADARYENDFTNAMATFLRNEFEVVAAHLEEVKAGYAETQMRLLYRDTNAKGLSKKDAHALADKQAAVRQILTRFDEVIKSLQLKAAKEAARESAVPAGDRNTIAGRLPQDFVQTFENATNAVSRAEVVDRHFCSVPVRTTGDVKPATVYALRRGESLTLLVTGDRFPTSTVIPLHDPISGKPLKPLTLHDFLALGKNEELVQLQPRQRNADAGSADASATESGSAFRFTSLDLTDFNQLLLAADQSGLISSVPLSNARDQYFRQQKYQHAFGTIERAYQEFINKAGQRLARLREEEKSYRQGRLKMSPREWQEKQRQNIAQTQRVERARKHFKLVMDGLRILHLQQQQEKGRSQAGQ